MTILVIPIILLFGCDLRNKLEGMIEETSAIQTFLEKDTNCDLVQVFTSNKIEGSINQMSINLIGCEFSDLEIYSQKVHDKLAKQFPNICEIRTINYIYVNKGDSEKIIYYKCTKL